MIDDNKKRIQYNTDTKMDYVPKSWGFELIIVNSEKYCGKLLHIGAGKGGSLHYHLKKDETFYLHSGYIAIRLRKEAVDDCIYMKPGDKLHIPPGQMHQIIGIEDSDLFEFSTEHFESDSYRVELFNDDVIPRDTLDKDA